MSNQSKFKVYMSAQMALKRSKVQNPGITATLLLECFLECGGELKASQVVARKLCEDGGFKVWRDDLIQKGWLCYSFNNYSRHTPGPKLLKYINKETSISLQISSTEFVYSVADKLKHEIKEEQTLEISIAKKEVKDEVNDLRNEVKELKLRVSEIIDMIDPPVTPEKLENFLSKTYKLPIKPKKDDMVN